MRVRTLGDHSLRDTPTLSFVLPPGTLQGSHSEDHGKIPLGLWQGKRKNNHKIQPECSPSQKPALQAKVFARALSQLMGVSPTQTLSSLSVSLKWEKPYSIMVRDSLQSGKEIGG